MYSGEKLNSISHLIGAVLALVGLGALLAESIRTGDPWVISSFSIFGVSLVLLYTMSSLYHSFHPIRLKNLFQLFDHVSIYLLIAGTYTPYMLVTFRTNNGWLMLGIVWTLALVGILSEIFFSGRIIKVLQLVIYLAMGWTCSLEINGIQAALPEMGYQLLVTGGLVYTVGVVFYVLGKLSILKHAHGIWHFFVLAGSMCHFTSIIGYVR